MDITPEGGPYRASLGRLAVFIHVQYRPPLNELHGFVQGLVSGKVGTNGIPDSGGQFLIRPVELGRAVEKLLKLLAVLFSRLAGRDEGASRV